MHSKTIGFARFCFLLLLLALVFYSVRQALVLGLPPMWHPPIARLHWFEIKEVKMDAVPPLQKSVLLGYLPTLIGRSLLTVQPTELYLSLKGKPWVDAVSIKKEYPDRLTIYVEAKRARAISFVDGIPFFFDSEGKVIERVPKGKTSVMDLPFISGDITGTRWKWDEVLLVHERLKKSLGNRNEISEIQLMGFPSFKVFLSKPRVEILFNVENWVEQVPYLVTLLANTPRQSRQIHRINLVFPKKAIVTQPISH